MLAHYIFKINSMLTKFSTCQYHAIHTTAINYDRQLSILCEYFSVFC